MGRFYGCKGGEIGGDLDNGDNLTLSADGGGEDADAFAAHGYGFEDLLTFEGGCECGGIPRFEGFGFEEGVSFGGEDSWSTEYEDFCGVFVEVSGDGLLPESVDPVSAAPLVGVVEFAFERLSVGLIGAEALTGARFEPSIIAATGALFLGGEGHWFDTGDEFAVDGLESESLGGKGHKTAEEKHRKREDCEVPEGEAGSETGGHLVLVGGTEDVSDSVDSMNQGGFIGGIDFFAEGRDVKVDGVGLGVDVVPDSFDDGFAGEDVASSSGEGFEEGEFAFGEAEVFSGSGCAVGLGVDDEVGDFDQLGFFLGVAAGDGADTGHEFLECEWFNKVVVGAGIEAGDSVFDGILGGQHEDGGGVILGADGSADFDAVGGGDHDVKDDSGVGVFDDEVEGGFSIAGDIGGVSGFADGSFEFGGDNEVVFDDEDAHDFIVGGNCLGFVRKWGFTFLRRSKFELERREAFSPNSKVRIPAEYSNRKPLDHRPQALWHGRLRFGKTRWQYQLLW